MVAPDKIPIVRTGAHMVMIACDEDYLSSGQGIKKGVEFLQIPQEGLPVKEIAGDE
jgi:hypothetical protein